MTTEKKTADPKGSTEPAAPAAPAAPADAPDAQSHGADPRDSAPFRGLQKEAARAQQEAAELRKELEKIRTDEEKRTKAKLQEDGKLQELLEAERKEKSELSERVAALQTQAERSRLETQLLQSGVTNEYARDGMINRYLAMAERPDTQAWIAELREQSPESFSTTAVAAPTGRASGSVGSVSQGAGGDLKTRLASSDPKVKLAALKERLKIEAMGGSI